MEGAKLFNQNKHDKSSRSQTEIDSDITDVEEYKLSLPESRIEI